jgi:hypothetical protein
MGMHWTLDTYVTGLAGEPFFRNRLEVRRRQATGVARAIAMVKTSNYSRFRRRG